MGSVREPTAVVCENTAELRARRPAAKTGPEVCEVDLTLRMQGPEVLAARTGDGADGMGIVKLLLWKELRKFFFFFVIFPRYWFVTLCVVL